MVPTLHHDDLVLVRIGADVRSGDVVLGRFADLPDRWVLKRVAGRHAGGWELASDNTFAGGDSRTHGPGEVIGRVLLCWHGRNPWPRRISSRPAAT